MTVQSLFTHSCVIAMGANLKSIYGDPSQTLGYALKRLAGLDLTISKVSRFYNTPAFPDPNDPPFVNACVEIRTSDVPQGILSQLHDIEREAQRRRDHRWAARSLDLDLISCDDYVVPSAKVYATWQGLSLEDQQRQVPDQLILPHPRIAERAFVLVPLMDIAPQWRHPVTGQTCAQMVKNLDNSLIDAVKPVQSDLSL